MGLAGGEYVVVGLVLLQHQPHALHIFPGMSPVALGIEVAEIKFAVAPEMNGSHGAGDFAGDEGLAADRALMVE